ncbi:hypothetical protein C8J57DRAFT_1234204 [Mycena rebaudengoi]|nr:hypothetical protein C8J57DRAFT_1234204 [Mycena rebaudengoi]
MPPPKMGTLEYEVPKVAIVRSMARIGSFRRSPPKLCHVYPPPTPENNPLPLAPAKLSNPLAVAHISQWRKFVVPILWRRIIALIILIIPTPDITSFGHSKPSQQVQQVKEAFLAPLELKPPDHSGDVTQLGKNCLRPGFLSYLPTAHTATNCGSCTSTASQHCLATAEQFRTHYANTPAAPHSCRQVPNTRGSMC